MTLELDGLVRAYDGFTLGPVDLTVGGEVLAVLGPSGCGKTTLLACVAGTVRPDAGSVRLDGKPLDGRPPERRGTVLMFQDGALFPHMTARENVAYAATDPGAVERLAATLELANVLDQPASTLSGGQQQRVALARSLAADPDVLLLDEPLSTLDEPIKRRLREEMREHLAALGVPVVYVTHDQREAASVGDRVAVMADGLVHQVGRPTDVFERPETAFVASFTGNANVFEGRIRADGPVLDWGPHAFPLSARTDTDPGPATFCVRPEHVRLLDRNADRGVAARLERRIFEGDAYRLGVRPRGVDATVKVRLSARQYDRLRLDGTDRVRVTFPPECVHVLPGE